MFPWLVNFQHYVSYMTNPSWICSRDNVYWICPGTDCMFECKYIYNSSCVLVHQQSNRSMFFLSSLFLALSLSLLLPLCICDGQNVKMWRAVREA